MFEDQTIRDDPEGPRSGGSLLRRAGIVGIPPAVLMGAGALALIILLVSGWRLVATVSGGTGDSVSFESRSGDAPTGGAEDPQTPLEGSPDEAAEATTVWVHVAGAVLRPGLRELPAGARVGDAVDAAGGASGEAALEGVNLASLLGDGEQVYVPTREELASGSAGPPGTAGAAPVTGTTSGLIDINTASEAELVSLPGVGPATAAKIVADRDANGPFASPEEIMRVSGIGQKKYESMRELITVR